MHDAYAGLNRLYLSMHSPAAAAGQDMDDPVMSEWIARNVGSGASILDAGCGLGFDVLALHNGLPARGSETQFVAYGADYSEDMLADARRIGTKVGIPESRYRAASFAGLADVSAWRESMDVVTVNYAIYTQPWRGCDYDGYLADSLQGLSAVLRHGGYLALNLRDWAALKAADAAGAALSGRATHDGRTYFYRYTWAFGQNRQHRTTLRMWENGELERETNIWFAERELAEIVAALQQAGFSVIHSGRHGQGAYAFNTLVARKV
jgi:SAM-dependent methyltransferase